MFRCVLLSAVALFVNGADHPNKQLINSGGKYPEHYPFEFGDDGAPPVLSFEHDEPNRSADPSTDNGGYRYWGYYKVDQNAWDFEKYGGFCYNCETDKSPLKYLLVNKMNSPVGMVPIKAWNCSKLTMKQEQFTGLAAKKEVCKVGDCCKSWYGLHRRADDADKRHLDLDTKIEGGLCETPSTIIYCVHVSSQVGTACLQTYTAPVGRVYPINECQDVTYFFWSSCPLYKATGYDYGLLMEPPSYMSMITPSDRTNLNSFSTSPDFVCLPYSYYYAQGSVTDDDDDSSASVLAALFALLF